jgi:hypothetical protein
MDLRYTGPFAIVVSDLGLPIEPGQTTSDAAAARDEQIRTYFAEAKIDRVLEPTVLDRAVLETLLLQGDQFAPADAEAEAVLAELVALAHPELVPTVEPVVAPAEAGEAPKRKPRQRV